MKSRIKIILIVLFFIPILVYGQPSFEEFMKACEPELGDKCIELYEKGVVVESETNNNLMFSIVAIVIAFALVVYYVWRKIK